MRPAAFLMAAAAAALVAACGSDTTSTTTGAPVGTASAPAGLPFTFEFGGQSSSPSFQVSKAGTYTVKYHFTPSTGETSCRATLALVSDTGDSRQVVPGIDVDQSGKDGSAPVDLTAGGWRFQEGGACAWKVTLS